MMLLLPGRSGGTSQGLNSGGAHAEQRGSHTWPFIPLYSACVWGQTHRKFVGECLVRQLLPSHTCALCECTGAEEELQAFMRLCEGVTKRGWQCALARLALPVFHPPFFFFFFFLTSFFIFFISLLPQIFTRRLLSLLVPGRPNPNVLLLTRPLRGNAKPRQFPWRWAAQATRKPPTSPPTPLFPVLLLRRCCHR